MKAPKKTSQVGLFDAPAIIQEPPIAIRPVAELSVTVDAPVAADAPPIAPKVPVLDAQKMFDDAVDRALCEWRQGEGARPPTKEWLTASGAALEFGRKLPWAHTGWLFGR